VTCEKPGGRWNVRAAAQREERHEYGCQFPDACQDKTAASASESINHLVERRDDLFQIRRLTLRDNRWARVKVGRDSACGVIEVSDEFGFGEKMQA